MPNNYELVSYQLNKDFNDKCEELRSLKNEISDDEYKMRQSILIRESTVSSSDSHNIAKCPLITLNKFKSNLAISNQKTQNYFCNKRHEGGRNLNHLRDIKLDIKMCDSIIPMFSTLIDIIKKQEEEIKELQRQTRLLSLFKKDKR